MIHQLSWHDISKLLFQAKSKIRLVLPSLHEEWAMLLEKLVQKGLTDIKVCINNSEKYMRDGFGDEKSIMLLKRMNIEIVETDNNRISLISADNNHYLFFPTSRVFESLNDEDITNAIQIDELTALRILLSFFQSDEPTDDEKFAQTVLDSLILAKEQIRKSVDDLKDGKVTFFSSEFDEQNFKVIQQNLKVNPVQSPDLKREIEVYTNKVQFVELKFENGKINTRRVKIPARAMPFQSAELKRILESSMRIFNNDEDESEMLEGYKAIQKYVKTVRECYLKTITCRNDKSLLEMTRKNDFTKEVFAINKGIESAKKSLINEIDSQIEQTQERLCNELKVFFSKNPPEHLAEFSGERLLSKVERYVIDLVYNIMPFPKAEKMVEGMSLKHRHYDLTYDDFTDEELLKEFEQKGILKSDLNSIRDLKKAFEVKK